MEKIEPPGSKAEVGGKGERSPEQYLLYIYKGYKIHSCIGFLGMELDEVLNIPDVGNALTVCPLKLVGAGLDDLGDDEGSFPGGG